MLDINSVWDESEYLNYEVYVSFSLFAKLRLYEEFTFLTIF